jgi:hypothetical protein
MHERKYTLEPVFIEGSAAAFFEAPDDDVGDQVGQNTKCTGNLKLNLKLRNVNGFQVDSKLNYKFL